jgi:hypothetical protein
MAQRPSCEHALGVPLALAGLVTTFLTGGAHRHNAIGMKGRLRSGLELAALHNISAVDIDHLTLLVCFILWGRAACVHVDGAVLRVQCVSGDLTVRCERCWQLLTCDRKCFPLVPRVGYCASPA